MRYFQLDGNCLLLGSMRFESPLHFTFFIRLLALCSQSRKWGVVCANDEEPYSLQDLADLMHMQLAEVQDCMYYHSEKKRIKVLPWGGIKVLNWDKYQNATYARKAKSRSLTNLRENVTTE
jgi:hypothetical protein